MSSIFRCLVVGFALLGAGTLWASPPTILVVGDSLSTGHGIPASKSWVSLLESRLREQGFPHAVVNSSVSGDTTTNGVTRIRASLARHRPTVVILELGGNDGLRGLPLESIRTNLAAMIETAQTSGARVLLAGMRLPPNYGVEYAGRFEQVYRELAATYDTGLIPFLLEGVATIPGMMQPDGVHPSESAQPVILDTVWTQLRPLLTESLEASA